MKKFFFILLFININLLLAQNKSLYVAFTESNSIGLTRYFGLFIKDSISYWHRINNEQKLIDTNITQKISGEEYTLNTNNIIFLSDSKYKEYPYKNFVLKDKKKGVLYFVRHRYNRPNLYVVDSLFPMKWEMLPGHKFIAGFTCKQARTHFRGRTYTAWYTPEIPVSDGPWKFGGLPGLILEVEEEYYHFLVTDIVFNPSYTPELPPIEEYDFISWEEYVKLMKKYHDKKIQEIIAEKIRERDEFPSISRIKAKEIIHPIYSKEGVYIPGYGDLKPPKKKKNKKKKHKRFLGIF